MQHKSHASMTKNSLTSHTHSWKKNGLDKLCTQLECGSGDCHMTGNYLN